MEHGVTYAAVRVTQKDAVYVTLYILHTLYNRVLFQVYPQKRVGKTRRNRPQRLPPLSLSHLLEVLQEKRRIKQARQNPRGRPPARLLDLRQGLFAQLRAHSARADPRKREAVRVPTVRQELQEEEPSRQPPKGPH